METWQTLFGVLMMLTITGCASQISISGPENVAGVIGSTEQFLLPCSISVSSGSPTAYTWSDGNGDIYIADTPVDTHVNSEHFELEKPGITDQWTDYGLVVGTPVLDVAQRYQCFGLQGTETVFASADVLLLEQEPLCFHNDTDEYEYGANRIVLIVCTVNYTGSWAPSLTWYNDDGQDIIGFPIIENNYTVAHSLVLEVDGDSEKKVYVCKTRFGEPTGVVVGQATNAPNFESQCTVTINSCRGLVPSRLHILLTFIASVCYSLFYWVPS